MRTSLWWADTLGSPRTVSFPRSPRASSSCFTFLIDVTLVTGQTLASLWRLYTAARESNTTSWQERGRDSGTH